MPESDELNENWTSGKYRNSPEVQHVRTAEETAADSLGLLLDQLPWHVYLSAWPRYPTLRPEKAVQVGREFVNALIGDVHRSKPFAAIFAERKRAENSCHVHATLQCPASLPSDSLQKETRARERFAEQIAREWSGDVDCQLYDPAGAAALYAPKDVGRPDTESNLWISPQARDSLRRTPRPTQALRSFGKVYGEKLPERRPKSLSEAVQRNE